MYVIKLLFYIHKLIWGNTNLYEVDERYDQHFWDANEGNSAFWIFSISSIMFFIPKNHLLKFEIRYFFIDKF